jgi:hypothetical protein
MLLCIQHCSISSLRQSVRVVKFLHKVKTMYCGSTMIVWELLHHRICCLHNCIIFQSTSRDSRIRFVFLNPLKPKLVWIIFRISVRTTKKTPHFTVTEINRLTLFKQIIAVCSTIIWNPSIQNEELRTVKSGGTGFDGVKSRNGFFVGLQRTGRGRSLCILDRRTKQSEEKTWMWAVAFSSVSSCSVVGGYQRFEVRPQSTASPP